MTYNVSSGMLNPTIPYLTCCNSYGVNHAELGTEHWSHVVKLPATPRSRLHYTCVNMII